MFHMMAPRRQPLSLYHQVIGLLAAPVEIMCNQYLEKPHHPQLLSLAKYLTDNLPTQLTGAIGEMVLAHREALQITLSPAHVKVLILLRVPRISASGSSVQSGVLETECGAHLQHLSLLYGGCGDRATKLYSFLHTTKNLTHLQCTDFCNNQMLDIIANNCERLQSLDLRGCYDVNDEGMLRLCGLQKGLRECIEVLSKGGYLPPTALCAASLKEIKLTMTKVTEAGVAVILLVLTHLELLRVPDMKMEQVFNFLQTLDYKGVQCNLKEFHSREILDEFQLSVLVSLCPNLEYIQVSLIGSSDMDLARLEQLATLKHLKRAKLADVNCDSLVWFLQQVGHRMSHIFLYTYHTTYAQQKLTITRNHLQCLAQFCPNLESLCIDGYHLTEDFSYRHWAPQDVYYFKNLQSLQLTSVKLSEDDLKIFLSKSHNLKVLELVLGNPHVFYDRFICDLLDDGVWQKLTKIRVLNSPITSTGLARLVQECPQLQEIGCLYTWLVSKQQISEFKERVKTQNLDIIIY